MRLKHMQRNHCKCAGLRLTVIPLLFILMQPGNSEAGSVEDKGLAIAVEADKRDSGYEDATASMIMILRNRHGQESQRSLRYRTLEVENDGDMSLMIFDSPKDVKGTAFLNYTHKKDDDDQWLYLPALKKVKRIPSADKSGSFMGSDFSYFDMTDRDLENYDFKLIKETEVRGHKAWMIESTPRNEKVIKESGYTKSVAIVRQDNYVVVRAINYMKNDKMKYLDLRKIHQQDGIWVVDEMMMTTKKGKYTEHKTLLQFNNIKVNKPLEDDLFTTRRLSKGL